jgi:hypothetical protein
MSKRESGSMSKGREVYICFPPLQPSHPSHIGKNGIRIEVEPVTNPSQKGHISRHKNLVLGLAYLPSPPLAGPAWSGERGRVRWTDFSL